MRGSGLNSRPLKCPTTAKATSEHARKQHKVVKSISEIARIQLSPTIAISEYDRKELHLFKTPSEVTRKSRSNLKEISEQTRKPLFITPTISEHREMALQAQGTDISPRKMPHHHRPTVKAAIGQPLRRTETSNKKKGLPTW